MEINPTVCKYNIKNIFCGCIYYKKFAKIYFFMITVRQYNCVTDINCFKIEQMN